jgi:hypothetical protein
MDVPSTTSPMQHGRMRITRRGVALDRRVGKTRERTE